MDMAAILVMWPRCGEQTFVPSTHWGSTWNLASIGSVLSEKFEECGWQTNSEQTDDRACLYYKLTYEPNSSGEPMKEWRPNDALCVQSWVSVSAIIRVII